MRDSQRCFKCGVSDISSYLDGLVIEPMLLVRKRRMQRRATPEVARELNKEIAALLEKYSYRVYVCGACGYTERYVNGPEIAKDPEVISKLKVRSDSPPAAGAYR